jgi:hypothetical protein
MSMIGAINISPAEMMSPHHSEGVGGMGKGGMEHILKTVGDALDKLVNKGGAEGGGEGGGASGAEGMPGAGGMPAPGGIRLGGDAPGADSKGAGSTPGEGQMNAQSAAGTLASYMHTSGKSSMTPDDLYSLSQNSGGNTPPAVSQAAKFMLQNPSTYQAIETHDVAGADGKSAVSNLDWAAQGGLQANKPSEA